MGENVKLRKKKGSERARWQRPLEPLRLKKRPLFYHELEEQQAGRGNTLKYTRSQMASYLRVDDTQIDSLAVEDVVTVNGSSSPNTAKQRGISLFNHISSL